MTKKLSLDLKVACEIYQITEIEKKPCWTRKLEERFNNIPKIDIHHALCTLTDWGIIYGQYGATEKGRAGYCYFIDHHDMEFSPIKKLYTDYYRGDYT